MTAALAVLETNCFRLQIGYRCPRTDDVADLIWRIYSSYKVYFCALDMCACCNIEHFCIHSCVVCNRFLSPQK